MEGEAVHPAAKSLRSNGAANAMQHSARPSVTAIAVMPTHMAWTLSDPAETTPTDAPIIANPAGATSTLVVHTPGKRSLLYRQWTEEEDKLLVDSVSQLGAARWVFVAQCVPNRNGKQCRERWFNHLCPEVRSGGWSAEEDQLIDEGVSEMGMRWSEIAKRLPGRTDNAIKNRYHSNDRQRRRANVRLEKMALKATLKATPKATVARAKPVPVVKASKETAVVECAKLDLGGAAELDGDEGEGSEVNLSRVVVIETVESMSSSIARPPRQPARMWTPEEDEMLRVAMAAPGAPQTWSAIAAQVPGRIGKQCRERWLQHLCPQVNNGAWTEEEDRLIAEGLEELGPRWSEIVKMLPGRTDNAIKNRYHATQRHARMAADTESGVRARKRPRARDITIDDDDALLVLGARFAKPPSPTHHETGRAKLATDVEHLAVAALIDLEQSSHVPNGDGCSPLRSSGSWSPSSGSSFSGGEAPEEPMMLRAVEA